MPDAPHTHLSGFELQNPLQLLMRGVGIAPVLCRLVPGGGRTGITIIVRWVGPFFIRRGKGGNWKVLGETVSSPELHVVFRTGSGFVQRAISWCSPSWLRCRGRSFAAAAFRLGQEGVERRVARGEEKLQNPSRRDGRGRRNGRNRRRRGSGRGRRGRRRGRNGRHYWLWWKDGRRARLPLRGVTSVSAGIFSSSRLAAEQEMRAWKARHGHGRPNKRRKLKKKLGMRAV
ncbi:unnamed protein product [Closterium sp. NIES-54]